MKQNYRIIRLKFWPGQRVNFWSPDQRRVLTGTIKEVEPTITETSISTTYTIEADEEIKSSRMHYLNDMELKDEFQIASVFSKSLRVQSPLKVQP